MAMIKCKECGAEISSKADACPKCGAKQVRTSGCAMVLLAVLGFFAFVMIVGTCSRDNSTSTSAPSNTSASATTAPAATAHATPPEAIAVVFDVPSLIGKSIDEVRQVLGSPQDTEIEPSQQQLNLGVTEWYNGFTSDGQDLMVTYNPRTRKVIDLFLAGSDRDTLMQLGNLGADSPAYRVESVKALREPSQITGLKIIPKG